MKHGYSWDWNTGKIAPVEFPAQETWYDRLEDTLEDLWDWLKDGANINNALNSVEEVLVQKHHDYGENNLEAFGELGILVRASDKVARLKNLTGKDAEVTNESRADTWRDLAGYAIQALIMMKAAKDSEPANVYEIRKNRLERGFCPDCGDGVLLRRGAFDNTLSCSAHCGFEFKNYYLMQDYTSVSAVIDMIARSQAVRDQKE